MASLAFLGAMFNWLLGWREGRPDPSCPGWGEGFQDLAGGGALAVRQAQAALVFQGAAEAPGGGGGGGCRQASDTAGLEEDQVAGHGGPLGADHPALVQGAEGADHGGGMADEAVA